MLAGIGFGPLAMGTPWMCRNIPYNPYKANTRWVVGRGAQSLELDCRDAAVPICDLDDSACRARATDAPCFSQVTRL